MANLVFDADEFSREIRVVMEERRLRTDDQPIPKLYEALNAAAFFAHPYHHPIVGWMNDLQNMTVRDAQDWYRHWYAPNNATMVVTGDVDPEQVHALADKYFGKLPRKALPLEKTGVEPPQQGLRRVTVKAPAENPYVALAFKAPRLTDVEKDQDVYALEVLAAVLDGYDNARLPARLVRTGRAAISVGASYSGEARGPVLFVLDGTPAAGITTLRLETLLRAEVQRIAKEGVTKEELERVKNQVIAGQIYKRDSIFGQAMEIGVIEMSGISHRQIDRIIEKIGQVTAEQVQAVAAKYFDDDHLTIATLDPLPLSEKTPMPQPAGLRH
jgi:zinc protease